MIIDERRMLMGFSRKGEVRIPRTYQNAEIARNTTCGSVKFIALLRAPPHVCLPCCGCTDLMETNEADAPESVRSGRRESLDSLMPLVYEHLRLIARHQLALRPGGATLSTTGLV